MMVMNLPGRRTDGTDNTDNTGNTDGTDNADNPGGADGPRESNSRTGPADGAASARDADAAIAAARRRLAETLGAQLLPSTTADERGDDPREDQRGGTDPGADPQTRWLHENRPPHHDR